ncbi:MAG: queuosine precursor transporter [Candidatus Pacebacteria bacterium]|nr:queuosine precursor transporter [Candidatus Paceibacterota bacterium]
METDPTSDILSRSRYLIYLAVAFVAVLMISNTTAGKVIAIGPLAVSGALIIFPLSYILGDVLTEVYGYRAARKVVWSGFAALVLMSLAYWIIQILPSAAFWENQAAYEVILGAVPRITLASMIAYFCGEFVNSYVLSRMKVWMNGKQLWMRTIASTIAGEGIDTVLFMFVAFAGVLPLAAIFILILSEYAIKVAYEVAATPITYKVIGWLKRKEGIDVYDRGIDYNPFAP